VAATRILHPLPEFVDMGFTGSLADRLDVSLEPSTSEPKPDESIVLSQYDVAAAIPTSISLPSSGGGVAEFAPFPTNPSAGVASVPIEFVGQP
jgi:hypothetical protein